MYNGRIIETTMSFQLAEIEDPFSATNPDVNYCCPTKIMNNTVVSPFVLTLSDFSHTGNSIASFSAAMPRNQSLEWSVSPQSMNSQAVTTS